MHYDPPKYESILREWWAEQIKRGKEQRPRIKMGETSVAHGIDNPEQTGRKNPRRFTGLSKDFTWTITDLVKIANILNVRPSEILKTIEKRFD